MYSYIKSDVDILAQNASSTCIFQQKPQIISIPGILIKEKFRYRIVWRGAIIADRLSIEQALEQAGLEGRGVQP